MSLSNQVELLAVAVGADVKLLNELLQQLLENQLTPSTIIQATEDLQAGNVVNLYVVKGAAYVRKANAAVPGYTAHGYVLENYLSGDSVIVHPDGADTAVTGLIVGNQYLSTTPGMTTDIAPSLPGSISQLVGVATSDTSLTFAPQAAVVLP